VRASIQSAHWAPPWNASCHCLAGRQPPIPASEVLLAAKLSLACGRLAAPLSQGPVMSPQALQCIAHSTLKLHNTRRDLISTLSVSIEMTLF
jgi:hypothetical protein